MTESIQSQINTGPNGQYDPDKLEDYVIAILDLGFEEVENFDNIVEGDRIKYTGFIKNKDVYTDLVAFRSGGIVIAINKQAKYLVFKSFGDTNFSIQEKHTKRIWIKKRPIKKEKTVTFKLNENHKDSRHKVYIDNTVVFQGRDAYSTKRFTESKKYKDANNSKNFKVE